MTKTYPYGLQREFRSGRIPVAGLGPSELGRSAIRSTLGMITSTLSWGSGPRKERRKWGAG